MTPDRPRNRRAFYILGAVIIGAILLLVLVSLGTTGKPTANEISDIDGPPMAGDTTAPTAPTIPREP